MDKAFRVIPTYSFGFETQPIKGYKSPENFPNCCQRHKGIFENLSNWFEKFPNCCKEHATMQGQWWFKKENYEILPKKIVSQLSFTEYQIQTNINSLDWYKDITDYIEINIQSFGSPPIGADFYLEYVNRYLQDLKNTEIGKDKIEKIIEYVKKNIENLKNPKNSLPSTETDLNILYSTYQKWLKIFPFDLNSYFGHLKEHFEKNLPLLNGDIEVNKYWPEMAKAKIHTKSSLIEALINLTDELLKKINGLIFYEQGLITDVNNVKLELIISNRKLEINEGYKNDSPDEEREYRRILKKWFNHEKKFFHEIRHLFNPSSPEIKEKKKSKTIKAPIIALFCFLINEMSLDPKGETEIVENYCKRICKRFKLT